MEDELKPDNDNVLKTGQRVCVFSIALNQWFPDGWVTEVATGPAVQDGIILQSRAFKVKYLGGTCRSEWLSTQDAHKYLRVVPSAPLAVIGTILKETHGWFTRFHKRHFSLSGGVLCWWRTGNDARQGVKPNGFLSILGLQMQMDGCLLRIKTNSSQGIVYVFHAGTFENAKLLSNALQQHLEYCSKIEDLLEGM